MQTIFLLLTAISSVGGAAALIAVAMICVSVADSPQQAGVETSLVLATSLLASALAVPYAQVPAHRFGIRRTFVVTLAVWSLLFLVRGIAIGLGAPPYLTVLLLTPFSGICQGLVLALNQVVLRAYSPAKDLHNSVSHYVAISGLAVAVGSPIGGLMVDTLGPAWMLIINGLSFIPLLLFVQFAPSLSPLGKAAPSRGRAWGAMLQRLRAQPRLRLLCLIGVVATVAFGPLSQLMVPLAFSLGYNLALHASLLMGALAAGALISPLLVRLQQSLTAHLHTSGVHASTAGYAIAGAVLLVIAIASEVFSGVPKLLSILALLILLGGFSNAARSFVVSGIQTGRSKAESVLDLSVFYFAVSLGMPVGALMWGQLIDLIGGRGALIFASAVTLIVMIVMRQFFARRPAFTEWAPTNSV